MHLLHYLAGSTDFFIAYKQRGIKLASFSDANWGNNPNNAKSTSSYIVMLANGPISFKGGIQGLTAQSTMEAELVAAALRARVGENLICPCHVLWSIVDHAFLIPRLSHPKEPSRMQRRFPN